MLNPSRWLHSALALWLVASIIGCSHDAAPSVLASGDGVSITADQFRATLNSESPAARNAYAEPAKRRELLEQLIDFEVLVAEARRQGLDKDPEILNATRQLMVQRLLSARQSQYPGNRIPNETELRAQYDAQQDRQAVQPTVRVLHLFLAVPNGGDRAARRLEAEALRAQAAAFAAGDAGDRQYGQWVRQHSEEAGTAPQGGDLTHRSYDQLKTFYSVAVADGAFALSQPGQVSPVLESERGLHVLRLLEKSAGRRATYEEFLADRAAQVSREARDQDLRTYSKALREKARVTVREDELNKVTAQPSSQRP